MTVDIGLTDEFSRILRIDAADMETTVGRLGRMPPAERASLRPETLGTAEKWLNFASKCVPLVEVHISGS